MPEKTYTRSDIVALARAEHAKIERLLSGLPPEQMVQPGVTGEWSIKDLLFHLVSWEQQLLDWLQSVSRGEIPDVPLTNKEIHRRNAETYAATRDRTLEDALALFRHSYEQVLAAVAAYPEEILAQPYPIPDGPSRLSLAWLAGSCLDRHYRGHRQAMQKWVAARGGR